MPHRACRLFRERGNERPDPNRRNVPSKQRARGGSTLFQPRFGWEPLMNAKTILLSLTVLLTLSLSLWATPDPRVSAAAEEPGTTHPDDPAASEDFLGMSIEQLMNVEVSSTAALTPVTARMTPAAVPTITQEEIHAAAARSLFELLDISAP